MKPSDAAECLSRAAAYDRRTIGTVEAQAWAEAIPKDYTVAEVIRAIVAHYSTTTDFLMPVHINTLVRKARADRREEITSANYNAVPDADPDDVAAYLAALRAGYFVDRSPKPDAPAKPITALVDSTLARRSSREAS